MQLVIDEQRLIDRDLFGESFPVRDDVGKDAVNRVCKLGVLEPDGPLFGGGDRDRALAFDALEQSNHVVGRMLAAEDRFVADDEPRDIGVLSGNLNGRTDFAFVARLVVADPGAHADIEPELIGNRGDELEAAGRGISAHGLCLTRDNLEVGADLRGSHPPAIIRSFQSRIGKTR